MELFFSPLACSMASRIALYAAGAEATYRYVDGKSKTLEDGADFLKVNPVGQVPALRTDDGTILTQNPAVLLTIADAYPAANLAPKDGIARARLLEWLAFTGTELHKLVFTPLLDSTSNDGARQYAREKAPRYLGRVDAHLKDREFLLDGFTVADAYLFTVLNWGRATGFDYAQYSNITAFMTRMSHHPAVAKAFAEEFALYGAEQQRRKAA